MGNMLATVLALIAGIPIALGIDRFSKVSKEKERFRNDRKKEKEILTLLDEELTYSLSLFHNGKKGVTISLTIEPLKLELWTTLISSEDTKYIDDPILLNTISTAYHFLRTIKRIEEQAHIALRTSAVSFTLQDGSKKGAAQMLLEDARRFDKQLENGINAAINKIKVRITKLEQYV